MGGLLGRVRYLFDLCEGRQQILVVRKLFQLTQIAQLASPAFSDFLQIKTQNMMENMNNSEIEKFLGNRKFVKSGYSRKKAIYVHVYGNLHSNSTLKRI